MTTYSIVIATHNRAHLLGRAVQSVCFQTRRDWELLIVDDASHDHTAQIAQGAHDPRIVYVSMPHNVGASAARNIGISRARGAFVVFLDDDDELHPEYLATLERYRLAHAEGDIGFMWCAIESVADRPEGEVSLGTTFWNPTFANRAAAYAGFLAHRGIGAGCGLCIKREYLEAVGGFDESLRSAGDADLLIRLAARYHFLPIPDVRVRVHQHEGERLNSPSLLRAEAYAHMIHKHKSGLRHHSQAWTAMHFRAGSLFLANRRFGKALSYFVRALQKSPLHRPSWRMLALTVVAPPNSWRRARAQRCRDWLMGAGTLLPLGCRACGSSESSTGASAGTDAPPTSGFVSHTPSRPSARL